MEIKTKETRDSLFWGTDRVLSITFGLHFSKLATTVKILIREADLVVCQLVWQLMCCVRAFFFFSFVCACV